MAPGQVQSLGVEVVEMVPLDSSLGETGGLFKCSRVNFLCAPAINTCFIIRPKISAKLAQIGLGLARQEFSNEDSSRASPDLSLPGEGDDLPSR